MDDEPPRDYVKDRPRRRSSDHRSMAAIVTMVGIPLTAIIGGFGWVVEKMLLLDEKVIHLTTTASFHEARLLDGHRKLDSLGSQQERLSVEVENLSKEQDRQRSLPQLRADGKH